MKNLNGFKKNVGLLKHNTRIALGVSFLSLLAIGCNFADPYAGNGSYQNSGVGFESNDSSSGSPGPHYEVGHGTADAESRAPVIEQYIKGLGYEEEITISVETRSRLRVRFVPGQQDAFVGNTNFSPPYSLLSIALQVGNDEEVTAPLSNGLYEPEEMSDIFDFSQSFRKRCETDEINCQERVRITIKRPQYNYWCIEYPNGFYDPKSFQYRNVCYGNPYGMTRVYESHPWNGTLLIETDYTESLN
jgi:hypothetical protein